MIPVLFASILIVALAAHFLAASRFERYVKQSMARVSASGASIQEPQVDPETLPEIVQKFIVRAGVSNDRPPESVRLHQSAELRMGPDKPWRPLNCEQVISIQTPGFVWYADQRLGPISTVRVMDAFVGGNGFLEARLFGSIPVARFTGPEADHCELMRYLAELAWAPDAVLHNRSLRWRATGDDAVELEADSNGGVARVRLYFNNYGDIVKMHADGRGSTENGVLVPRPWRGMFSEHREMGGRRIPTYGEVGYIYDQGYSAYWRGCITSYELVACDVTTQQAGANLNV